MKKTKSVLASHWQKESTCLIRTAIHFTENRNISTLLINTYLKSNIDLINSLRTNQHIAWILPEQLSNNYQTKKKRKDLIVSSISHEMDAISRINFGIFFGYIKEAIGFDEIVACLTTRSEKGGGIDTFHLVSPKKLFPWLADREQIFKMLLKKISLLTFINLLKVSMRLAKEGKEGKSIGTMFVLADLENLQNCTEQLILNPLEGHPKKVCSINNSDFFETIRELSSIDGGFVVSPKGVVHSAGTYFHSPVKKEQLKKGFGTRHAAAVSVTKDVESIAVVLSESSKHISVFYAGKLILDGGFIL